MRSARAARGRRAAAPWSRDDMRVRARGRGDASPSLLGAVRSPASRRSIRIRCCARTGVAVEAALALCAAGDRAGAVRARARGGAARLRPHGCSCLTRCGSTASRYTLSGAHAAGARRRQSARPRRGRDGRARGRLGQRQVDPAARRLRPRAALLRRDACRSRARLGPRHARRGARAARRRGRARAPGPGGADRDERRARGDRAAAREPRACAAQRSRARSRRRRSRSASPICSSAPSDTLSGGELQRVALAAALAARPGLLLLDEPTSQLDPVAAEELLAQLRRLNEDHGTTVVLAEQRLERCLAAADRVIALEHGRVACDAAAGRVSWSGRRAGARSWCRPAARMISLAGLDPLPVTVKQARSRCAAPAWPRSAPLGGAGAAPRPRACAAGGAKAPAPRSRSQDVWVEWDDGSGGTVTALRGLDLELQRGRDGRAAGPQRRREEHAAARGRRGRAAGPGRRARRAATWRCCVQTPVRLPAARTRRGRAARGRGGRGAAGAGARSPRRCATRATSRAASGSGSRSAVVLAGRGIGGGAPPAVVALDEPTRGMDQQRKRDLAERIAAARRGRARP